MKVNNSKVSNELKLSFITKNIYMGTINRIITIFLSFISRTVFIQVLGLQYLGIGNLFVSILHVLSMADLGFQSAIVYCMYKPIVNKDNVTLSALMTYFKKIYRIIAIAVLIIGLSLIPLLDQIVNLEQPIDNLLIFYLMYLANTIASYLFIYKTTITTAHQKSYLLNSYDIIFTILQVGLQIILLLIFRNFILYLFIQLLGTFSRNFYKAYRSEQLYPFIREKVQINNDLKKEVINNVKSMFVYRIGATLLNNIDNIFISILAGTIWIGYYSNYILVVTALTTFITIVSNSIIATIGNINVNTDIQRQYKIFNALNLLLWWIFSLCATSLLVLFQDFIEIWLGSEFQLSYIIVLGIVLNFYLPGTLRAISIFRDTTGMFKQTKYIYLITCILNLILSFLMGNLWGLAGILFATVFARLLTNFWFEPYIIFRNYFKISPFTYFKNQGIYWLTFSIATIGTLFLGSMLNFNLFLNFLIKIFLCLLIPNALFLIMAKKRDEFQYINIMISKIMNRRKILE